MTVRIFSRGVLSSLNQLKFELNVQVNHSFGLLKAKKLLREESGEIKLHLGCGKRHLDGWLNIDIRDDADLFLDLREKWPFSDCCVNNIFAEHLLEHFEYPDNALHFLNEAYRVLKPGAELRLGVPDTEWPLKAYVEGIDSDYFKIAKEVWHPKDLKTSMEHINWHFRDFKGEHKYAYDEETLYNLLENAGFVEIKRSSFNPLTDSEKRRVGTLYVTARKP